MPTNLKQQFINRLNNPETGAFRAAFFSPLRVKPDNVEIFQYWQYILFEPVTDGQKKYWSADIEHKTLRLVVGKYTTTSVHLYRYVAGCKVSLVLPFSLLLQIEPIQP